MSEQELSTAAIDRISSLPDDILIHILSSVPTKEAFLTSILSKRWIYLWCYVPVLEFTETRWKHKESHSHFEKFVFSVFRSREAAGNHSLDTFILNCKDYSPQLCDLVVGNWGTVTPELRTAYTMLARTTLVVLKLHCFRFYTGARSHFNLPSLKTLHLKDVYFDQQRDFMLLLDGCPVLEDLQLSNIELETYTRDYFNDFESSSMLTKLNRADITACHCYFPLKSLSNLEFLHIKLNKYYDFPTFDNLTHLVLNYDWNIVVILLHHCPKLQNLHLYQRLKGDSWKNEYITRDYIPNWVDPKSVPSCISLNLTTCTMRDFALFGLERNHTMLARFILENARVLETMSIWCYRKRSKVERALSSCPRASATSQLSIYWW